MESEVEPRIIGEHYALQSSSPRSGGTARVYKATDIDSGRAVAVKLFEGSNLAEEFIRESFLRETEALTALRHPNIVELIASGFDTRRQKCFVVLEWIEEPLPQYLAKVSLDDFGWDTFAESVVLPILDGLAFAHARNVLHRDIKPSNILILPDGTPKIADFGIAKLVDSLRIGVTVSDFGSRPYAPPERGKIAPSPREDLFSLGITILKCLVPRGFEITHTNLSEAVYEADLPDPAAEFVRRLVALDPAQRPLAAATALSELRRLQQARPQEGKQRAKYYLLLPDGVANDVARILRCADRRGVEEGILKDLEADVAIRPRPKREDRQDGDESYYLTGQELSYHVKADEKVGACLVLLKVIRPDYPSLLERDRESGLALVADFSFQNPPSVSHAREAIDDLRRQIAEFSQDKRLAELREEDRGVFRQWENILQAKTDLEQTRQNPLPYRGLRRGGRDGRRITFEMEEPLDGALVGQARRIATKRLFTGSILDTEGHSLTLELQKGDPDQIPETGTLIIDQTASETAIRRQRSALQETQQGMTLRPDLGQLLIHPEGATAPHAVGEITPLQPDLDDAKREALSIALGSTDLTAVEGPPGTGKTKWIAELICQYLRNNPGKRVLLSGQTHTAVDNALERIKHVSPDLRLVRVGRSEHIATAVEEFCIENQVPRWGHLVRSRSERYLQEWAAARGISDYLLTLRATWTALMHTAGKAEDLTRKIAMLRAELFGGSDAEHPAVRRSGEEAPPRSAVRLGRAAAGYLDAASRFCEGLDPGEPADRLTELATLLEECSGRIFALLVGAMPTADPSNGEDLGHAVLPETLAGLAPAVLDQATALDDAIKTAAAPVRQHLGSAADAFVRLGLELAIELDQSAKERAGAESSREIERTLAALRRANAEVNQLREEIAGMLGSPKLARATLPQLEAAFRAAMGSGGADVSRFDQLQSLQRQWVQVFGKGEGFEAAVLALADVVAGTCVGIAAVGRLAELDFDLVVIDEASKATPTEALVAMRRGRQWVLVGDDKQLPPFAEDALWKGGALDQYDLDREDLQRTLFDRLVEKLPRECRPSLSVQYRMVPAIGSLISECFYGGALKTGRSDETHPIVQRVLRTPVTWYTTSGLPSPGEIADQGHGARSYKNLAEAVKIREWLERLEFYARAGQATLHIGVISGYKAQERHLVRELTPGDETSWQALRIEINSVDAFQGREVDVLVYSVTRSNPEGDLGFLASSPRLNVALSRGRDALVIFGDADHCRRCPRLDNPFRDVLRYIETHPVGCSMEVL